MSLEANPISTSFHAERPVVLYLARDMELGPESQNVVETAKSLKSAGGTPIVASAGGRLVHELDRHEISHFNLPLDTEKLLPMKANIKRLVDVIDECEADIVHSFAIEPGWSGLFAARQTGAAFITSVTEPPPASRGWRQLYQSILSRGERVLVPSRYLADRLLSLRLLAAERLVLAPPGIDLVRYNPEWVTAERMSAFLRSRHLPEGQKLILCPGPLVSAGGAHVLLEAIVQLNDPDSFCLLMGPDEDEAYSHQLEAAIVEKDLVGRAMVMRDSGHDWPVAMALASTVVLPDLTPSGFPLLAAETLAMGRPLVASHIGAMEEVLGGGDLGWLCRPNDPAELAKLIRLVLEYSDEQIQAHSAHCIARTHPLYKGTAYSLAALQAYAALYKGRVPWQAISE